MLTADAEDLERAQAIADSMGITVQDLLDRLDHALARERGRGYKDPTGSAALDNLEG